jgi:ABC-type transport system involved in multi-copper enzyme maturation permease subunit
VAAALPLLRLSLEHDGYGYRGPVLPVWFCLEPFGAFRGFSAAPSKGYEIAELVAGSAPALLSIPVFLLIGRLGVTRSSESRRMPPVLRLFLALDRWFAGAEARIGRRVARDLPGADPVAWREINRRALANSRYLVRLGIPLALAVIVMCLVVGGGWRSSQNGTFLVLFDAVVGVGAVVLLGMAIPIVDDERSRQTLDVLLTTPLTGRAILAQKLRALRRVQILVSFLPLLVVGWLAYLGQEDRLGTIIAIEAGTALLLPAAVSAVGAASGIFVRGRGRTAGVAAAVLAAWLVIPMIAGPLLLALGAGVQASGPRRWAYQGPSVEVSPTLLVPLESISPYGLLTHSQDLRRGWWYGQDEVDWQRVLISGLGAQAAVWIAARLVIAIAADRALRRGGAHA